MDLPIELDQLSIGFRSPRGPTRVLAQALTAKIPAGRLICLMGRNGAGKSTLLRTIAHLADPVEGEVRLFGMPIGRCSSLDRARKIAVGLTGANFPYSMLVRDYVALGRIPYRGATGGFTPADADAVEQAVLQVDAKELANRPLRQLSDGERQRVQLARILAQQTPIVLLDEPFAFLDLPRRIEMMGLLRELAWNSNRAIVVSTHDLPLALAYADTVWILSAAGLQIGPPEEIASQNGFADLVTNRRCLFDPTTGEIQPQTPTRGVVHLVGAGPQLTWTARALARLGWKRADADHVSDADFRIELVPKPGDAIGYALTHPDGAASHYATLGGLLEKLMGCQTTAIASAQRAGADGGCP